MLRLHPRGAFSLAESVAFVESFAPLETAAAGGRLRLALTDDDGTPLAFAARQEKDGAVVVEHTGGLAPERVEAHVARVLSLDVDGRPLADIARRDPVVAGLVERFPGRRPVCFGTPFEAAAWAVISQRVRMTQAAALKARLTDALGAPLELGSDAPLRAFPSPARLAELEAFPGLWPTKAARLRALAAAALAGDLDPARLRTMPPDAALRHLASLPGLGPFGAALVLIRGAGHPDVTPTGERRLRAAASDAYGRDDLEAIADGWRPLRSWVAFLLRNAAEDEG
jgi:DNA-3-methyladenine glycosylase II